MPLRVLSKFLAQYLLLKSPPLKTEGLFYLSALPTIYKDFGEADIHRGALCTQLGALSFSIADSGYRIAILADIMNHKL